MKRLSWLAALSAAIVLVAAGNAHALSLRNTNIVDLLNGANDIVVAQVRTVTDGIDERGLPYTEVKLEISETIRGNLSGTYTFRQFGLVSPRLTADGQRKMMPAPEGFPRFVEGEQALLFLHPAAQLTGLRTTEGLSAGKFVLGPGRAENALGNAGLFRDVRLDSDISTDADRRMLVSDGAMNPQQFLSFVRRAVAEQWVQTGKLLTRAP